MSRVLRVRREGRRVLIQLLRLCYPRVFGLFQHVLPERALQRFVRFSELIRGWLMYDGTKAVTPTGSAVLPPWIVGEMKALAHIDPSIDPTREHLERYGKWTVPIDLGAYRVYRDLLPDFLEHAPDVIFLIPHLQRGGADLGIIHHVRLCVERKMRVTVVVTRDVVSPWLNRLPEAARVVEFGRTANLLNEDDQHLVLVRLLLQSSAKRIHLINSQLAWSLLARFGLPLKTEGKLVFASVFCDDQDRAGRRCGYATEFLPRVWMHLAGVFSDNRTFLSEIKRRDGVPSGLLHVLYFPTCVQTFAKPREGDAILWASRVTLQKRPELLCQVAEAIPDRQFDVHGEIDPRLESFVLKRLKRLPNVRLRGRYESLSRLAESGRYGVLLYTSCYDGLPNVLLEAAATGLPIVAPDVGGIAELVSDRTGYLVSPEAGVSDFVLAIREVLASPAESARRVECCQELLRQRHSWASFSSAVVSVPGYLNGNVRPVFGDTGVQVGTKAITT